MKPKTNFLASKTERLIAHNAIPKALLIQYEEHQVLTTLVQESLKGLIETGALYQCQAVRYSEGELIITTPSATLANHLRYLNEALIEALKAHHQFQKLASVHIVQLGAG